MDKRAFKNFITRRSSIWTLSLCITGILALGGIAALDNARRTKDNPVQTETVPGQTEYLEENAANTGMDVEDELFPTLKGGKEQDDLAQASGSAVSEDTGNSGAEEAVAGTDAGNAGDPANTDATGSQAADSQAVDSQAVDSQAEDLQAAGSRTDGGETAEETVSGNVISEQALLDAGVSFTGEDSLLWPSAGTILIDYSMDGSVYFPTLDQYKYNPALIIGSEAGNQVVASAKGIVESVRVEDETGITLVLNIGNGYRLTYGQLKELAVEEGDVVEAGALLGYVSEPTKYYSVEGSNLYFGMTQDDVPVDPVLYLE